MKTSRRPFLLFSLAGCWAMIGVAPMEAAEGVNDATVAPVAALCDQRRALPVEPVSAPVEAVPKGAPEVRCNYLITVADDFVVDVYHNGKPVPETKRELLVERFGATAEKVKVSVRSGDWLVFHVVQNRLRWGGSKYFAVAGCFAANEFGFVS